VNSVVKRLKVRIIRTKQGTEWPESGSAKTGRLARFATRFIPKANPDYESKLHLVCEWLVEFDDQGRPSREIGLDNSGLPVFAGPDSRNYGFWLDTDMTINDFEGAPENLGVFENLWNAAIAHANR
jgi:hypothetical protein